MERSRTDKVTRARAGVCVAGAGHTGCSRLARALPISPSGPCSVPVARKPHPRCCSWPQPQVWGLLTESSHLTQVLAGPSASGLWVPQQLPGNVVTMALKRGDALGTFLPSGKQCWRGCSEQRGPSSAPRLLRHLWDWASRLVTKCEWLPSYSPSLRSGLTPISLPPASLRLNCP